jgi:dipeptidase E
MIQLLDLQYAPMAILLISNSSEFGRGYLDHVEAEIKGTLGRARTVLFVPFALFDRSAYVARARARLEAMGYAVEALSSAGDVDRAEAIFVGGGNTFRLLKSLQDLGVLEAIRRRVRDGMPYIGSSAGSIVAGPTLKTTKDMPIVQPRSFDALALVDFQISPHYLDPDPSSKHMGETQEERILQFLEENDAPVVGLREGAFLRVDGGVFLGGETGARIFRRSHAPAEARAGERLDRLLYGDGASP